MVGWLIYRLCRAGDKLYLAAYDKFLEGDQEHAYIFLLRYLDVVQAVRNSKDYKANKVRLYPSLKCCMLYAMFLLKRQSLVQLRPKFHYQLGYFFVLKRFLIMK